MAVTIPDPSIVVRAEVPDDFYVQFVITGDLSRRTPAIDDAIRALRDACESAVAEKTGRAPEVTATAVYDELTYARESITL